MSSPAAKRMAFMHQHLVSWSEAMSAAELEYFSQGLTKTKGSVLLPKPSASQLKETFQAPFRQDKPLSCGARGMFKGKHPDWFFGHPRGGEEQRNKDAVRKLLQVCRSAVFENIFWHARLKVIVYEVRVASGHGIRWRMPVEGQCEFLGVVNGWEEENKASIVPMQGLGT